jgi:hypothetical protein
MNNTQLLELFGKAKRYTLSHGDCIRRGGLIVVTMAERKRNTLEESNTALPPNETPNLTSTVEENMEVYVTVAVTNQKDGYMCMYCGMCDESEYLKC